MARNNGECASTVRLAERKARLRAVYRRHASEAGPPVEMASVRAAIEGVARAARAGWRAVATVDHVALAEASGLEELEDLEFLVSRGLGELNGIKNALALARRLA